MNLIIRSILSLTILCSLASCAEQVDNTGSMKRMEDTLFKTLPTVNRLSVEVIDQSNVKVTLGDKELYNDAEEKRKQAVADISAITKHVFSTNKQIKSGTIQFVEDETSTEVKNEKSYPMAL